MVNDVTLFARLAAALVLVAVGIVWVALSIHPYYAVALVVCLLIAATWLEFLAGKEERKP